MVRHHHERMDGHGYPDGLIGSDIPLGARIIAVADTFDAIISSRSYRSAGTHKKALDILSNEAGSQLDGAAVAAFLSRYSARRSVAWFAFVTAAPQRIFAALQTASPSLGVSTGGVASILPALGAAGLLTLSPGLRHDTLVDRGTYRQPVAVLTQSHQPTIPAAPTTDAPRHHSRQTASTRPTSPGYRPSRLTLHISPSTPVSKNPPASTPNSPTGGTGTVTREPVVAAAPTAPTAPPTASSPVSTPPPTASSPAPTPPPTTSSPAPTPPPTVPPVNEAPKLPVPPISLPVTLPSVNVNLPPVHVHVP